MDYILKQSTQPSHKPHQQTKSNYKMAAASSSVITVKEPDRTW